MAIRIKVAEQHFPVVLIINKVHKVESEQILKMKKECFSSGTVCSNFARTRQLSTCHMFSIAWLFCMNWISCLIPWPSARKQEKFLSWQENPFFQSHQMGFLSSPVLFYVLITSQRSLDSRTTTRATLNFKLSRLFPKMEIPESCIVLFFTTKVSTLISVEGG